MIKKIIKLIGLFTFVGFGFFYTDKVINVIREEDEIMITLNQVKNSYEIQPVDARVISNTIVPGMNGRVVNVDQSYKNMKTDGVFNQNLF